MSVVSVSKQVCSVTRKQFLADAVPLELAINGVPLSADVKEFSTGSLGWFHNGKMTVKVGGRLVTVQIGCNLTVVGSRDLPAIGEDSRDVPETPAIE